MTHTINSNPTNNKCNQNELITVRPKTTTSATIAGRQVKRGCLSKFIRISTIALGALGALALTAAGIIHYLVHQNENNQAAFNIAIQDSQCENALHLAEQFTLQEHRDAAITLLSKRCLPDIASIGIDQISDEFLLKEAQVNVLLNFMENNQFEQAFDWLDTLSARDEILLRMLDESYKPSFQGTTTSDLMNPETKLKMTDRNSIKDYVFQNLTGTESMKTAFETVMNNSFNEGNLSEIFYWVSMIGESYQPDILSSLYQASFSRNPDQYDQIIEFIDKSVADEKTLKNIKTNAPYIPPDYNNMFYFMESMIVDHRDFITNNKIAECFNWINTIVTNVLGKDYFLCETLRIAIEVNSPSYNQIKQHVLKQMQIPSFRTIARKMAKKHDVKQTTQKITESSHQKQLDTLQLYQVYFAKIRN